MTIEKKTIRSDIPGSHVFLNNSVGYVGTTIDDTRRLLVARDITLNGNIGSCSYLVVEGVVQSESFSTRRLDVADGGLFSGTAEVRDCVIAGRFEGNLTVTGRLTVKPTGHISGTVNYASLEIEAGAKLEAQLTMIPAAEAAPLPILTVLPPVTVQSNVAPLFTSEEEDDNKPAPTGRAVYRRAVRV